MTKKPPETLREAAALYEERNTAYGDDYKKFGNRFFHLFEDIHVGSPQDANRLAIFTLMLVKLSRYTENFNSGGHDDSLKDLSVYAAMLLELDQEQRSQPQQAEELNTSHPLQNINPWSKGSIP